MKSSTLLLILLVSCFSAAQEFPRYELAAGYSYGTTDDLSITNNRFSPQGWNGSLATNLKRWMAIEVDAGGQYLNKSVLFQGVPYTLNSGFYAFHAGPRFNFRTEKLTPFVHTLFGIHRTLSYTQATFPAPGQVLVPYENALGSAAGGGFDVALSRRLSLRTQGDYFFTRLRSPLTGFENRFRVVGGLVFNFGVADSWRANRSKPRRRDDSDVAASAIAAPVATPEIPPVKSVVASPASVTKPAPAYATVAPAPAAIVPAAPNTVKPAAVPAPKPATSYVAVAPKPAPAPLPQATGRVVPATQNLNSQVVSRPPSASGQEESLGEIARRYRQQKKQQQTH